MWKPKTYNPLTGALILQDDSVVTEVLKSEGDMLSITQSNGDNVDFVAITKNECYDILFNYFSQEDLETVLTAMKDKNNT